MAETGGFVKETDYSKLGGALLVAACLILAVRTARWSVRGSSTESDSELENEVAHAAHLAHRMLSHLVSRSREMFPAILVPWFVAGDEEDLPQ